MRRYSGKLLMHRHCRYHAPAPFPFPLQYAGGVVCGWVWAAVGGAAAAGLAPSCNPLGSSGRAPGYVWHHAGGHAAHKPR